MHDASHRGGVVLTLECISAACLGVLVQFVGAGTPSVELRQNARDVRRETPRLLEILARITPRGLEVILAAIEVGEKHVHPLHQSLDLALLPVSAVSRPFDDQIETVGRKRIAQSNEVLPKPSEESPMALEFRCALRVLCVDACVEQATPRAWERYEDGDVRSFLEDRCDLLVSCLGREVILFGDVDDLTQPGIWVCPSHVRVFVGAEQYDGPIRVALG